MPFFSCRLNRCATKLVTLSNYYKATMQNQGTEGPKSSYTAAVAEAKGRQIPRGECNRGASHRNIVHG